MAEKEKRWKFKRQNPTTGKRYFELVTETPALKQGELPPEPDLPTDFTTSPPEPPKARALPNTPRRSFWGNANAGIVSEKMDRAADEREESARKDQT